MKNKVEYFKSHQPFYEYINKYLPLFEVKNSVPRGRYTFIYDGKQYPHNNLYSMLATLNTLIGKDLLLLKGSRSIGRLRYGICIDCNVESELSLNVPTVSLEETLVEVDTIVSEVVEDVVEVESVESEVVAVDWSWVDSLEDSPENRLALDEYALKFSVPLKRTMKVSNMAKKFKEALA